jgi:hypothetical protein
MWGVQITDLIGAISALLTLLGVVVAVFAIRKGNRNSSAATVLTLNDGFRQAWQRFVSTTGFDQDYEWHELMNLLEIGCAILLEGSLAGISRKLARLHLVNQLLVIEKDSEAARRYADAMHDETVFENIRKFQKKTARISRKSEVAKLTLAPRPEQTTQ